MGLVHHKSSLGLWSAQSKMAGQLGLSCRVTVPALTYTVSALCPSVRTSGLQQQGQEKWSKGGAYEEMFWCEGVLHTVIWLMCEIQQFLNRWWIYWQIIFTLHHTWQTLFQHSHGATNHKILSRDIAELAINIANTWSIPWIEVYTYFLTCTPGKIP